MNPTFHTFGEILWDCLPDARHAGGAPFNVAAHLAQLEASAHLISSVGQDVLGDEILALAQAKNVGTRFVTRARIGLATGAVQVVLDENFNASYQILQPAAWDEIVVSSEVLDSVGKSGALIFGSLAGRSETNRAQLLSLLERSKAQKFFDVNLRPPFVDPIWILELGKKADVIKLNEAELAQWAGWSKTGKWTSDSPKTGDNLAENCASVARLTETSRICVTRGEQGAAFWDSGNLLFVEASPVKVRDTVGAGDAFMAALVAGMTFRNELSAVLSAACRLGAYVASQEGATPPFPPQLIADLRFLVGK